MSFWDDLTEAKGYGLYSKHKQTALSFSPKMAQDGFLGATLGELLAIPVDYVFEIYVKGALKHTVALPMNPQQVSFSRPSSTAIDYGFGKHPIRQHTRNKNMTIQIRGRSGYEPRQGHDRVGNLINKLGPEIALEFDAFLDMYQDIAATRLDSPFVYPYQTKEMNNGEVRYVTPTADNTFMVFRSFIDNMHLRVEPTVWTLEKQAKSSRFSYEFDLQLQAYAPFDPEKELGVLGWIDKSTRGVRNMIDSATAVIGAVGAVAANLSKSLDGARGILHRLGHVAQAFQTTFDSYAELGRFPKKILQDYNLLLRQTITMVTAWDNLTGVTDEAQYKQIGRQRDLLTERLSEGQRESAHIAAAFDQSIDGLRTGAEAYDNTGTASLALTSGGLPAEDPNEVSVPTDWKYTAAPDAAKIPGILYTIDATDTLESLALWFYGDAAFASLLLDANAMIDAFTKKDGTTLQSGDVLIIPQSSATGAILKKFDSETVYSFEDLFDHDLFIDPATGDLEMSGTTDARTIRGPGNLTQAIRHRLLTIQGEIPHFQLFGMPAYIGKPLFGHTLGHYASHLNHQMLRDPRIFEVNGLTVSDEGDGLFANVSVQPTLGSAFAAIVPLD